MDPRTMTTSTSTAVPAIHADVIDQAVPLASGHPLHALRRERPKIVDATQGSYDAMFAAGVQGLSVVERLAVALHASRLCKAEQLAAYYHQRLVDEGADPRALLHAPGARLELILDFSGKLIVRPLDGDKTSIDSLLALGLTTPAIVALGQLIAFLSYQVRVVAGLQAMADATPATGAAA
jgi:uncharacterized protein YciW